MSPNACSMPSALENSQWASVHSASEIISARLLPLTCKQPTVGRRGCVIAEYRMHVAGVSVPSTCANLFYRAWR